MNEPARFAVDATVLIALAESNAAAWRAVELLRESVKPCDIVVTPAAIVELALVLDRLPATEPVRQLADTALRSLRGDWEFRELDDAAFDRGTLDTHLAALLEARLLPPAARSSGAGLLEAASKSCRLLVTWDRDLGAMDYGKLRTFLVRRGLYPLRVATPLGVAELHGAPH